MSATDLAPLIAALAEAARPGKPCDLDRLYTLEGILARTPGRRPRPRPRPRSPAAREHRPPLHSARLLRQPAEGGAGDAQAEEEAEGPRGGAACVDCTQRKRR